MVPKVRDFQPRSQGALPAGPTLENLLTSYRIGKPRNSKIPPNIQKRDSPKYLFRYPPGD